MKKQFLILFAFISVLALSQVPQRFNKVIVTGDITSPKFIKTGSNADSVLLGNGSTRSVTSLKTDTVSLSNRINAKATGNGTANGTNTGDETLTSIKTKLGAATPVSDGYLKYQDFVNFNGKLSSEVDGSVTNELQTISTTGAAGNITLSNSGGTLNLNVNDADASPTNEIQDLSLSGNTLALSSDATTVDISQATAVQANTAKVSNATHTGDVTGSTALTLATVNSNVGTFNNVTINAKGLATAGSNVSYEPSFSKNTGFNKNFGTTPGTVLEGRTFGTAANSAVGDFIQNQSAIAQNANIWIKTGKFTSGTSSAPLVAVGSASNIGKIQFGDLDTKYRIYGGAGYGGLGIAVNDIDALLFNTAGAATFSSTVNSTGFLLNGNNLTSSLTTNYIPKWNGSSFVNATSGTDYQLPITLTTNGTSGAATFSGNVLNVPNYNVSGGVNQTLTTVNGSTGGDIVGSMPFQTANYKKVIVYVNFVSGNATYTFPTQFNNEYNLHTNTLGTTYSSVSVSGTSVTITGATNAAGVLIIEGY